MHLRGTWNSTNRFFDAMTVIGKLPARMRDNDSPAGLILFHFRAIPRVVARFELILQVTVSIVFSTA